MDGYPRILHHGAAEGVTGSCHRLQIAADRALLIDCGLFQGAEAGGQDTLSRHRIDFPLDDLLALIVTHVHIDHVGRLPYLLAAGYQGPILCSRPSAELLPLVIEDALKVGFTRDARLIQRFLAEVGERLLPLDYKQWHTLVDDARQRVRVRLQRAGHILGSAYVEIDVQDHERGGERRIVFSGDLGAPHAPLLPAPKSPQRADVVVLESTYGDRRHEGRAERRERLRGAIDRALTDQGTVIIPAFSIGRTQELLYELEGLIHRAREPRWQGLEIIVDSPLAARFTDSYRRLKPYWDAEAHARVRSGRHPLSFDNLYTVDSHAEHLQTVDYLARTGRPAVVLAASGMAAGGRVVNYLKAMLEDPRHAVLFVGYQAAGTPGRDIQRYGPSGGWVVLDGRRYEIRARVESLSGYSAHADQKDLLNFIGRMGHRPEEVRLIHGDVPAQRTLQAELQRQARARGEPLRVTRAEDHMA
ncbi:MBL fold metallo-hydrolase RNA specificity domain-containing protein [Alkalilimnicola sp. S0819]|uniref:MBL fold metallo-hydrolase RNA specificity domain-containing protein n=1 Tax=Alkalilimnicola sp. S0819 TaxID=2613922 RepID=UPI001261EE48|nr:MBL fold metallo-hydrolase [Alkalilimnicola sp. S0819]KAB7628226.1 MBL fold metallo-hydrolase [Alkalilimnicola sp. S0819]MPQ15117.1 MBL fold metallo-hydrolase [Alkalilimnicola sp. S0819]